MAIGKTSPSITVTELFNKYSETQILKAAFPEMAKAMEEGNAYKVELTLQEISKLYPGRRVRLDAYKRLIRFLATQQITLTLTSRKTKN